MRVALRAFLSDDSDRKIKEKEKKNAASSLSVQFTSRLFTMRIRKMTFEDAI